MQSTTSGQPVSSPIEIQGTASLKNGQILFGKVNKVFANQTAEVQIGHQKMIAALDIPLRAGERYWFQIQPPNEGKVVLKALDSEFELFQLRWHSCTIDRSSRHNARTCGGKACRISPEKPSPYNQGNFSVRFAMAENC
ncbi:hypothetical protein UP17_07685 [Peribacillus simplex]|nr:hypothetical protein UP17_07685 [Peribacillus simplex]